VGNKIVKPFKSSLYLLYSKNVYMNSRRNLADLSCDKTPHHERVYRFWAWRFFYGEIILGSHVAQGNQVGCV